MELYEVELLKEAGNESWLSTVYSEKVHMTPKQAIELRESLKRITKDSTYTAYVWCTHD